MPTQALGQVEVNLPVAIEHPLFEVGDKVVLSASFCRSIQAHLPDCEPPLLGLFPFTCIANAISFFVTGAGASDVYLHQLLCWFFTGSIPAMRDRQIEGRSLGNVRRDIVGLRAQVSVD